MRSCHLGSTVALLLSLGLPANAHAQEQGRPRLSPSLYAHAEGILADSTSDVTRWPDGSSASPAGSNKIHGFGYGLGAGMACSVIPRFTLGLRGRWLQRSPLETVWGRRLDVVEAVLVPQLNLLRRIGNMRPYVAVPLGAAWSIQRRSWTRAVEEEWNSRPGLTVGGSVGIEVFGPSQLGLLLELGYQARFLSASVISTPVEEPQSRVSERVTTTQHQIIFSAGLALGLRR